MRRFVLLALVFSALAFFSGGQSEQARAQQPDFAQAIAAQARHTPGLLNVPGIAGTGIGASARGEAVIRIYVETTGVAVPPALDKVPVERVVTGRFEARCYQTECPRPVPLGVSTGHPNITAGTIGARVKDGSGNVYALSNNHVYANSNNASIGDSALQPGPYDGGTDSADKIGTLAAFEAINFSGGDNHMDAAIALTTTAMLGNVTFSGYKPTSTTVEGSLNLNVKKEGRTTGVTSGQISEINVTVTVCYESRWPFGCAKSAKFVGQLAIGGGSFSAGGDSGSLIVTQSGNHPVGLLFAGGSNRTIANRIQPVLTEFGVSIDDSTATAPPPATNSPPTASFTHSCTDLSCSFNASGSTDTDGTIQSYAWDFGDGSPTGSGATTSHTYLAGATYQVTLTVTDDDTASDSESKNVTVANSGGGSIVLDASTRKVKGVRHTDLTWSPADPAKDVDVYRNGVKIATTDHDGAYTDTLSGKGGGSFTYQVCEAGTSVCSNAKTVSF